MSDELFRLRAQIDAIDGQLLKLLSERAGLAQAVGQLKNGEGIYRAEREAQVVRRMRDANPGPLSSDTVERLFREIISACRDLEQPLRVAYLGPQGTFSQAAVHKHFGHAVGDLPCTTIDEAFRSVETGKADYCVVPVENSTEGAVSRTLDLIVGSPLKVGGEVYLPIHQNLLRKLPAPGGKGAGTEVAASDAAQMPQLKGITRVYGHAQSLGQCQNWLNKHLPNAQRVSVISNSEGARLAAQDADSVALAGEAAAEIYGLTIIAPRIEDEPNNTTRFLVLSCRDTSPSGKDKTALVLSIRNRPGALVELLKPFAAAGVSLTKLESRPARQGNWEYLFFVDCEGHRQDAKVAAVLAEVSAQAAMLKVLGSYPSAASS
ncbi:MAG: prephenate dehydratase [Thiobacillaceae bacterium]